MADDTDFIGLYQELGVAPDSSPEQFKRAYRRRVAELHPDRHGDAGIAALTLLNRRYTAALAFLKEHGRLPGAAPATGPAVRPGRSVARMPMRGDASAAPAATDRRWSRAVLAVLVAFGAVWMFVPGALDPPGSTATAVRTPGGIGPSRPEGRLLALGVAVDTVRTIQGDPIGSEGGRWLYGASWLRFECDELVDWYSSPLQPLKTTSIKPPDPDPRLPPPKRRRCPPTPVPDAPTREPP